MEHKLEFSGLPNQCGKCRSREHSVRYCPKNDNTTQKRPKLPSAAATTAEAPTGTLMETNEQEAQQSHDSSPSDKASSPKQQVEHLDPTLQPNDINFPQLPSPTPKHSPGDTSAAEPEEQTPTFIWRPKTVTETQPQDKGKTKISTMGSESTPLTRQGYRSGRLAEDFWTALGIPETPTSARKRLKVIPFITKNEDQQEYLVNKNKTLPMSITEFNVA